MQIQKQKIILIAGIVLALISVFMIKLYLDQQRVASERMVREKYKKMQENQASVLVAVKDIAAGAAIDKDSIETQIMPNQYVQPRAATSLDRVAGMLTVAPISKGEQITLNKLIWPQEVAGGTLAMSTPAGKRAITISVDNIASLAGMVKPGDYVDVILAIPGQGLVTPLFQNVLVLAVGQETGKQADSGLRYKKEEKREASPLITLALNPQEASLLALAQEQGKIRLLMRHPSDAKIEPIKPANAELLFQYIFPDRQIVKKAIEEGQYVEVQRGDKIEKVPLADK